jgi:hypothetical protein
LVTVQKAHLGGNTSAGVSVCTRAAVSQKKRLRGAFNRQEAQEEGAEREFRIKKLAAAMQTERGDTKVNVERKQGMTDAVGGILLERNLCIPLR